MRRSCAMVRLPSPSSSRWSNTAHSAAAVFARVLRCASLVPHGGAARLAPMASDPAAALCGLGESARRLAGRRRGPRCSGPSGSPSAVTAGRRPGASPLAWPPCARRCSHRNGLDLWTFLRDTVGFSRADIVEWQPVYVLGWDTLIRWSLTFALGMLAVVLVGRADRRPQQMVALLALAAASFMVTRLQAFFAAHRPVPFRARGARRACQRCEPTWRRLYVRVRIGAWPRSRSA